VIGRLRGIENREGNPDGVIRFNPCDVGACESSQATHIDLPLVLKEEQELKGCY